jgi:hypothetical protein
MSRYCRVGVDLVLDRNDHCSVVESSGEVATS